MFSTLDVTELHKLLAKSGRRPASSAAGHTSRACAFEEPGWPSDPNVSLRAAAEVAVHNRVLPSMWVCQGRLSDHA
jgi:hypothetical protein